MKIIGPDYLVFGVSDLKASAEYLTAFGLTPVDVDEAGGLFEALDGTGVIIRAKDHPDLPPPLPTATMLRQQVLGVVEASDIDAIAEELGKDRKVYRLADGSIETVDDLGFALKFQVTKRRKLEMPAEKINAPGAPAQRKANEIGVWEDMPARPRSLSHHVLFVPDMEKMIDFYTKRLGFVITDVLTGAGPFLRPKANDDHHTHFFIRAPDYMQGLEHLAFHMGGPTELMVAGSRFVRAGYESFWGPGRHKFGSNWFWYFNSPLGTHFEYDADMDKHDDEWVAREAPMGPEASQILHFQYREKWAPGPGPGGK
ncbi:VOC family protein [Rhizobium sp. L1K21]|uniref:VOC family protein n=1 Tax=Rhizobium sp. L1K21 TaxID=2954933 RepID=UPI002092425F|nr:VOC family protein [Rhizobium sp. L1K21]MCO6187917.1 VOC family protein [Rhizobium sp. L1K21]